MLRFSILSHPLSRTKSTFPSYLDHLYQASNPEHLGLCFVCRTHIYSLFVLFRTPFYCVAEFTTLQLFQRTKVELPGPLPATWWAISGQAIKSAPGGPFPGGPLPGGPLPGGPFPSGPSQIAGGHFWSNLVGPFQTSGGPSQTSGGPIGGPFLEGDQVDQYLVGHLGTSLADQALVGHF